MNHSESVKELAAALAKAQGEIKPAIKDSENPYFQSSYADLASVVAAIREPLSKHGLSYVQLTEPCEGNEVRVETIILHSSGEWISGVLRLPVSKADAQGFGSALTYARRYGLAAAIGVAPEDDDGNAASGKKASSGVKCSDCGEDVEGAKFIGDSKLKYGKTLCDICQKKAAPLPPPLEPRRYTGEAPAAQPQRSDRDPAKGRLLITEAQGKRLYAIAAHNDTTSQVKDYIFKAYGYASSKDIEVKNYEAICRWAEGGSVGNPDAEAV